MRDLDLVGAGAQRRQRVDQPLRRMAPDRPPRADRRRRAGRSCSRRPASVRRARARARRGHPPRAPRRRAGTRTAPRAETCGGAAQPRAQLGGGETLAPGRPPPRRRRREPRARVPPLRRRGDLAAVGVTGRRKSSRSSRAWTRTPRSARGAAPGRRLLAAGAPGRSDRRQPQHALDVEAVAAARVLAERRVAERADRRRRRGGAAAASGAGSVARGLRLAAAAGTMSARPARADRPRAARTSKRTPSVGHPPDRLLTAAIDVAPAAPARATRSARPDDCHASSFAAPLSDQPLLGAGHRHVEQPPLLARLGRLLLVAERLVVQRGLAPRRSRARPAAGRAARRARPGSAPRASAARGRGRPRTTTGTRAPWRGGSSSAARRRAPRPRSAPRSRATPDGPPSPAAARRAPGSRAGRGRQRASCSRARRISLRTLASRRRPPGIASIARS